MNNNFLKEKSIWFREQVLNLVNEKKIGHAPSCLSMTEILVSLFYGGHLNFKKSQPNWEGRDKLIVSKGHAAMGLYPIFADIDFIKKEDLSGFNEPNGKLGLYADYRIPGIEGISGSLGHGIGMASGFVLADRLNSTKRKNFVIIGDGECYEGSIWESAMFASHHNMNEIVVIIDRNQLCILGKTENELALGNLKDKWQSFGWNSVEIDGHDFDQIDNALNTKFNNSKPLIIVANTVKGKGVSFMENNHSWHNKIPSDEQFEVAFRELKKGI